MTNRILVLPDIHGRDFWKEAVADTDADRIIFLGDYLDPYWSDLIRPEHALAGFQEIIELKEKNRDRVTLLLGNHDMGYLNTAICDTRHDWDRHQVIGKLMLEKMEIFDICSIESIDGLDIVFSHAGFHNDWINSHTEIFPDVRFTPLILNEMLHDPSSGSLLYKLMAETSPYRGGFDKVSSPVWLDINEVRRDGSDTPEGFFQIVGHSRQDDGLVKLHGRVLDVDCGKPFILDGDNARRSFGL